MSDSFTEVRRSWASRLKGSLGGIAGGLALVVLAVVVLFANEGRSVRRERALDEGARAVVPIAAERLEPAHEGELVHLSGLATTGELLADDELGVTARAIRLERTVEMFQWRESSASDGDGNAAGSTRTGYTYRAGWSERPIDSSDFRLPAGHGNPTAMAYGSRSWSAGDVRIGAFRLSPGLVERIGPARELVIEPSFAPPAELAGRTQVSGGELYLGADPAEPAIGDLRVRYRVVEPAVVTVVARQSGDGLEPYPTRSAGRLALLRPGSHAPAAMFASARGANRFLAWLARTLGCLLMMLGFRLVFRPLRRLADLLPTLGYLADRAANLLAIAAALPLALLTMSVAWIVYRPLVGSSMLLFGAIALVGILWLLRRARGPVVSGAD